MEGNAPTANLSGTAAGGKHFAGTDRPNNDSYELLLFVIVAVIAAILGNAALH
ncbi:MAG: hypothetical protein NT019_03075 [Candidatus Adlerbacteria bacterium]|nr:hypothetical protein [Candidatus Adlerbacteria bacterium]